jgi:hypothetical protein
VAPEIREIFEQSARRMGAVPGGTALQAYCLPILEASRALGAAPGISGKLPALIRALVCLRAAQLVGCLF